jgi:hypothetical protein
MTCIKSSCLCGIIFGRDWVRIPSKIFIILMICMCFRVVVVSNDTQAGYDSGKRAEGKREEPLIVKDD